MIRTVFLILMFSFPILSDAMSDDAKIEALLHEARQKLAPDKRTAVFNVEGALAGKQLTLSGELHSRELKQRLFEFIRSHTDYAIVDELAVLPQSTLGQKVFGIVNVSVANLRTKPGHAQEMATQALLGTPVKILKQNDDWYLVQTPDEYLGWTDDVIVHFDKDEYDSWLRAPKLIVTTTYAHSYTKPNTDADVASDIVAGNILKFKGEEGDFFLAEYPKGKTAYISKKDAQQLHSWLMNAKPTPERIIATAKRFMGVPYLWGGTSTKTMDCSGFTKTVYFLNGVLLPRDASQQALVGERFQIDKDFKNLKMGDLVFFGAKANGDRKEKVTHIGVYIDSLKFIHESGDVRINSFDPNAEDYSAHRTMSLLGATRIIGVGEGKGVQLLLNIPYYSGNERKP
jgi:gamma-D-glutamyl-L-lysine dipeptidyl-peptidase